MFFGRAFLFTGPNPGEETLDRPLSNYDVIGVPTGAWSSNLWDCFSNMIPSCVVSFCCPCVMWAQIIVRAQIPFLIGLKNSFPCFRGVTGYGAFVDYFMASTIISFGLIIIMIVLSNILPSGVTILFALIVIATLGTLIYLLAHTRTAFKEKYSLPNNLPIQGASFWEKLSDVWIMTLCLPCALAQMGRHVFQYDRMDSNVGLFLSDPSTLPPLRPTDEQQQANPRGGAFERPEMADEAGLHRHRGINPNSGAAHRQQAIEARQREEMLRDSATPTTASAPPGNNYGRNNNNNYSNNNSPPIAAAYIVK